MKIQPLNHRTEAFNRTELFVVIGVVVLLAVALLLPALAAAKRSSGPNHCVNRLHQIGLAFRTWTGDHGDKYPMQLFATNIFGTKLMSSGNAYILWRIMSNELSTPKTLLCPQDTKRTSATNFNIRFSDANISYFVNLDALNDTYPQMILSGDDNLAVNGVRAKPGILTLPTTNSLTWTKERHRGCGNIGMADGSVVQTTPTMLNAAVIAATNGAPVTTYRWVIP